MRNKIDKSKLEIILFLQEILQEKLLNFSLRPFHMRLQVEPKQKYFSLLLRIFFPWNINPIFPLFFDSLESFFFSLSGGIKLPPNILSASSGK
jgi:hypothetical protein